MKLRKISKNPRGANSLIALLVCFVLPLSSLAATTITVDSVVQRWPWNNKVDITYTIVGGQDLSTSNFCKVVFSAAIDGNTYTIDGATDVGASANEGQHTVTWTLPSGIKSANCSMSAAIYESAAPSGDDYMIIDLTKTSNNITWEGLLASQEESDRRYNADVYKTSKLVLRKVPAGGPYPTGDGVNYSGYVNTAKKWTTDRDYYVGIFPVTQMQYKNTGLANPSSGSYGNNRPVDNVSWNNLRVEGTAPASQIPTVNANSGTFFQRLNYITGNKYHFDLPTEVMFEIAQRAGAETTYAWGSTTSDLALYCAYSASGTTYAVDVAEGRIPNGWGIWDMTGNIYEICRDDGTTGDLASRSDAFTPASTGNVKRSMRGGGAFSDGSDNEAFKASCRRYLSTAGGRDKYRGFRVSMIAD